MVAVDMISFLGVPIQCESKGKIMFNETAYLEGFLMFEIFNMPVKVGFSASVAQSEVAIFCFW